MNDHKFASLMNFLFAEDRKKNVVAPGKVQKMLANLWKKAGNVLRKTKGYENEQPKNRRTGEKGTKG